jgi:hypothetical protein
MGGAFDWDKEMPYVGEGYATRSVEEALGRSGAHFCL